MKIYNIDIDEIYEVANKKLELQRGLGLDGA